MTAFPAAGALTTIAGTVGGLAAPAAWRVVMYLQEPAGGTWWIKPVPGAVTEVAPDGTFVITGWASYPAGDVAWAAIALYVIPISTSVPNGEVGRLLPTHQLHPPSSGSPVTPCAVLGGPLPGGLAAASAISRVFPRGFTPAAPSAAPTAGPHAGPAVLSITAFPSPGTLTPVGGRLSNVAAPSGYMVALYLQAPDGTWWVKPLPNQPIPIAADGTFLVTAWASYPAGDVNFQAMHLYVLPVGTPIPTVLGGPLPTGLTPLAAVQGQYVRGYVAGTASSPFDPSTDAAGSGGSGGGGRGVEPAASTSTLSAPVIIGIAVAAAGVVGSLTAMVTGYWVWTRRGSAGVGEPSGSGSVGARRPAFGNPATLSIGDGGHAAAAPARSTTASGVGGGTPSAARLRRTPAAGAAGSTVAV